MKLHLAQSAGLNMIEAFGDGHVTINGRRHQTSLVLMPEQVLSDWEVPGFDLLTAAHFTALAALRPEIVLLGTGIRQRFPHPSLYADLIRASIGIEIMNTASACRTYNILAAEGRHVVAALIIEPSMADDARL